MFRVMLNLQERRHVRELLLYPSMYSWKKQTSKNNHQPSMDNKIIEDTEMISTFSHIPPMPMKFDPNLLSMPTFGFRAEYLYQISAFLQKKIDSAEFRKFPKTLERLKNKQEHFMELYERAKIEESNNKEKRNRTTIRINKSRL